MHSWRDHDLLRRALGESVDIETVVAGGLWTTLADPHQLENALLNAIRRPPADQLGSVSGAGSVVSRRSALPSALTA